MKLKLTSCARAGSRAGFFLQQHNRAKERMLARNPARKPDDSEESKRFIDRAREVEACEDPKDFERAFKNIVQPRDKDRSAKKD